ncbi:MAG: PDZ domain-containing protein [Acidobacteria bacterium]|nr:PDZ domain-containing protein [Acidobacteriota bacterium]
MSGCPNCRAYVSDGEMFCRSCGFNLASFQVSTQNIDFPKTSRVPVLSRISNFSDSCKANWNRHVLPIMGFLLALSIGSTTAAFLNNEPVTPQTIQPVMVVSQTVETAITKNFERSYMGVYLIYDGNSNGALIDRIVEGSPAELAGLVSGDRIMSINETEIFVPADALSVLSTTNPGSLINMRVQRDDIELNIGLNTVRRNQLQLDEICYHQGFLGVSDLTTKYFDPDSEGNESVAGVYVGQILENSAAENAGLVEGDTIQTVNGIFVFDAGDLSRRIRANKIGDTVELGVLRNDEFITINATLSSRE